MSHNFPEKSFTAKKPLNNQMDNTSLPIAVRHFF